MTDHGDLARRAEAGELIPTGKILRGSDAAAHGQQLLIDATEADSLDAAVTIARGRPRLDAASPADVTWKIRTTAILDREVRRIAETRGATVSQLIREAVANYVRAFDSADGNRSEAEGGSPQRGIVESSS